MVRFVFCLLFIAGLSHAELRDDDKAFIFSKNILKNPGFEPSRGNSGRITLDWTASGGSFSAVTSGSNLLVGSGSVTWDSSAAAQTLSSGAVTIPNGLYGRTTAAGCLIKVPSGTATHKLQVYDGTTVIAERDIFSGTNPLRTSVVFISPTSGTMLLRILSVASDEPSITIDSCYLGDLEGYDLSQASAQDVLSAKISDTDVVSGENVDWINGNCTDATTGLQTCNFNAGFFTVAPNCVCSVNNATNSGCAVSTVSSTAITLRAYDNGGGAANRPTSITCQKASTDALADQSTVVMVAGSVVGGGSSVIGLYSAAISSADAVSNEVGTDWINGNCTDATAGRQTCNFNSGIFSATPNCQCITDATTAAGQCRIQAVSSTSVTFHTNDNTGSVTNLATRVMCMGFK